MKLNEVINRALKDPEFAKELQYKAIKAAQEGSRSEEWSEYMNLFEFNPESLARMNVDLSEENALLRGTTTMTTVAATSTAPCALTTTTTTTTDV